MSKPAIKVEGLYKEYVVGHTDDRHGTFYDLLAHTLKAPLKRLRSLGGQTEQKERFWALHDVNFEIQPGEVVGIIGRNGAGKSTLLKILSRITAPSKGRIEVRGKLASLLEVGTGFHPELSGRENIYLNGAILGMTRREVARKFDEIVAFAELEKFIDTPVKRYSSGMYVRLAFAVAANIDADVILVDEVLAVGDIDFQKRCLGKMEEVANTGRTVVFVSHNMSSIRSLCSSGLLLKGGVVVDCGPIGTVIESYTSEVTSPTNERLLPEKSRQSDLAYIQRVAVRPASGEPGGRLKATKPVVILIDVLVLISARIDVFLHCYSEQQTMVFSSGSFFTAELEDKPVPAGLHQFNCTIPEHLLNDGNYTLDVMLVQNRKTVFVNESSVLRFRIEDDFASIPGWEWRPAGVIRPNLNWARQLVKCRHR